MKLELLHNLLFSKLRTSRPRWKMYDFKNDQLNKTQFGQHINMSNKLGEPQKPKKQYYFIVMVVLGAKFSH